jgi:tectonic-1/3|eukprot:COSAG01_NODE_2671_length_7269_cov_10.825662_4_plen_803_part_00
MGCAVLIVVCGLVGAVGEAAVEAGEEVDLTGARRGRFLQTADSSGSWTGPNPTPAPPPSPANTVKVSVTLDTTIERANQDDFQNKFKEDLAAVLSINASRIEVTSVAPGSVVVGVSILPDTSGTPIATATLTSKLTKGVIFLTLGVQTAKALSTADISIATAVKLSYYHIDWTNPGTLNTFSSANYEVTPQDVSGWGGLDGMRNAQCTCDLTVSKCDITSAGGCACDPDCSSNGLVSKFTSRLPEGQVSQKVKMCDAGVTDVNLDMMGQDSSDGFRIGSEFVDSQLCVVKTNNPSLGTFYTDPGALKTVSTTYNLQGGHLMQVGLDSGDYASQTDQYTYAEETPALVATASTYSIGDAIERRNSANCASSTAEYIEFPEAGFTGECSPQGVTAFGVRAGPSFCTRRVTRQLQDSCATVFSSEPYVGTASKPLCFATTPEAGPTPMTVIVRSTTPAGTQPLTTSWEAASNTCRNAMKAVYYTVTHDTALKITGITAEVWYTDIQEGSLQQNFTISYETLASPAATFSGRGLTARRMERSGAPGYVIGAPLLGGSAVTQTTLESGVSTTRYAIRERVGGLAVVGMAPGGTCTDGARAVRFMHDTITACNALMDMNDLKAACQSQGSVGGVQTSLFSDIMQNHTDSYVGVFGDAVGEHLADWVEIKQDVAISAAAWSETDKTCGAMVTEYRLNIFTAPVGNVQQAQSKVVGAYYSYGVETVRFAQSNDNVRQAVELRTVVTFIELPDKVVAEQLLKPPRLVPELPTDIFYPFTLNSEGATSSVAVCAPCVSLVTVAASVLMLRIF